MKTSQSFVFQCNAVLLLLKIFSYHECEYKKRADNITQVTARQPESIDSDNAHRLLEKKIISVDEIIMKAIDNKNLKQESLSTEI